MATARVSFGTSGRILGDTTKTIVDAPGANKAIKVTSMTLDWNNGGAYIVSSDSKNKYYVYFTLRYGSTDIYYDRFYRQKDSEESRPNVSWSGNIQCTENTAVEFDYSHDDYTGIKNQWFIEVTYEIVDLATKCSNPTSVSATRSKGTITISWSGAKEGTANAITGYKIIRNTSKSDSGATVIKSNLASTATSGNTTDAPAVGTYYYGVKTLGTVTGFDADDYAWMKNPITMIAKPAKLANNPTISEVDMEILRKWINNGATATVQHEKAEASLGNTYAGTTVTKDTTIFALTWYNNQL